MSSLYIIFDSFKKHLTNRLENFHALNFKIRKDISKSTFGNSRGAPEEPVKLETVDLNL